MDRKVVPEAGLEPARSCAPRDFKSLASTHSATPASEDSLKNPMVSRTLSYHKAFPGVKGTGRAPTAEGDHDMGGGRRGRCHSPSHTFPPRWLDCRLRRRGEQGGNSPACLGGGWCGGPNGTRTRVTDVRGRRPRPLDDGTVSYGSPLSQGKGWSSSPASGQGIVAGERGFEPLQADPESAVLPLDDSPTSTSLYLKYKGTPLSILISMPPGEAC